jgi:hypothetical protein
MTDLTGTWTTLVTDPSTPDQYKYASEIKITQTGSLVTSLSAPGWDTWQGNLAVDPTGKEMLTAACSQDGRPRIIRARVSQDGNTLYGEWCFADEPRWPKGGYLAKRKISTERGSSS